MTKKPTARKKAPKAKPAAKRRVSASRPPRPGRGNVVTVSGGGVGIGGDVRGRTCVGRPGAAGSCSCCCCCAGGFGLRGLETV